MTNKILTIVLNVVVWLLMAAVVWVMLAIHFETITIRYIQGKSMLPTLYDSEKIVSYKTNDYKYGDIVTFKVDSGDTYIKRVIGVAGDVVHIYNGGVYVNGEKLNETYLSVQYTESKDLTGAVTIPEGYLFVLGDNREVSDDSRYTDVGLVSVNSVVGELVYPRNKLEV